MRNFIETRDNRYAEIPENLYSDRCSEKTKAIIDDPNGYKVTDEYNHDDVRTILRKYFGLKCVYCEASPIATSTFRIDHFRPKKNIKNLVHTGYYWLAYEWTNLLQSCQLCNGPKSNHFPLKNETNRVTNATLNALDAACRIPTTVPLVDEERLLLNPELDNVEKHFHFLSDGSIESDSDEGNKSIECYDLNRGDLILSRKQIRDQYLKEIKEALKSFEHNRVNGVPHSKDVLFGILDEKFKRFLIAYKNKEPFSRFHFYMFDEFENFFISEIPVAEYQDFLREAYNSYKLK